MDPAFVRGNTITQDQIDSFKELVAAVDVAVKARATRQRSVYDLCAATLGVDDWSIPRLGNYLLQDALEAANAVGVDRLDAHSLVDAVFDRHQDVRKMQEILGDIGVSVLMLAQSGGLDADQCEAQEVMRLAAAVVSKPDV